MDFLLFVGNKYYPEGGALDYFGRFETIEKAIAEKDRLIGIGTFPDFDDVWWNVLDVKSGTIVAPEEAFIESLKLGCERYENTVRKTRQEGVFAPDQIARWKERHPGVKCPLFEGDSQ